MKLKNYLAMMAIALCAVACSDNDDKKEDTVIPAQEVAGIYNGTLSLSVSGNEPQGKMLRRDNKGSAGAAARINGSARQLQNTVCTGGRKHSICRGALKPSCKRQG